MANKIDVIILKMIEQGKFKTQKGLASWANCAESYITKWKNQGCIPKNIIKKFENEFGELINYDNDNNATIKYYKNIKASAGYGVENSELEAIPVETTKDFLRSFFKLTSFSNLEIITVYGDSMLPYLQDGETILIQRTSQIRNNQIIIIRVENDIYVKRYIKEPFSSTIKLISENKNYDDITITSEQFESIQIIGVVCGSFRLR